MVMPGFSWMIASASALRFPLPLRRPARRVPPAGFGDASAIAGVAAATSCGAVDLAVALVGALVPQVRGLLPEARPRAPPRLPRSR